jgi:hypothetical protein
MEDNKTPEAPAPDQRLVPICVDCGKVAYHCYDMLADCECENPRIVQVPIQKVFEN